jgi:hypothetical protein
MAADPQRPDVQTQAWLFPEEPGEMSSGLPLLNREARDGYLTLLLYWFGLRRVVRLAPKELWLAALAAPNESAAKEGEG